MASKHGMKARLVERLAHWRERLDAWNGELASRSVPAERRERVSELALNQKAARAGQRAPSTPAKAPRAGRKRPRSSA
ncbi:hypothetical protein [Marinobacter sp. C2H3]|uniref:hypothetical protein n=1 Tax=Marinobacter sp. C2H3 TaxID=3119003 RepID=UPI00300EE959